MLIISALSLVAIPACEEDDGSSSGGGGSFEPSVDESKPIGELDEGEQQDLCDEAERFAAAEIDPIQDELTCISVAAFGGLGADGNFDAGACQQAYDDCLANPPETEPEGGSGCDLSGVGECDASVGEFVACWEEGLALTRKLLDDFSCDAEGGGLNTEPPPMPACEALYTKCPDLGAGMGG